MELHVTPETLANIKDQVVLITGSSSGIGLATVTTCLHHGAKVIAGDINPPSIPYPDNTQILFLKTDVSDWTSLRNLFIQGHAHFGRIDHVFANAGIGPRSNFLEETLDEDGLLAPPVLTTVQINLMSVISTVRLGVHYLTKDVAEGVNEGGAPEKSKSIVLTASASSFQNFSAVDYTTAKHGVLGILRGFTEELGSAKVPVRMNAIAPSWTATGMVPREVVEAMGSVVQEPEVVGEGVVMLLTERERHGELLYIWAGRHFEINKAKGGLLDSVMDLLPLPVSEDDVMKKMKQAVSGV